MTAPPHPVAVTSPGGARAPLELLYQALFENGVDGVLLTQPDGTVLRANAAACRAFGLSEEELCAQGRARRVVDDDALRAFLAERDRTGAATGELRFRHGDGTILSVEASSAVILDAGGARYAYLVFKDVTARRGAELALRESEQELRLLADAMPQIVCVLAPDGRAEYVNRSWSSYSGLDLEGTRRAGWATAVHADDLPAALECRRRVLKTLEPQDVELRYRAADGTYRWFLSRLAPVVDGGRVVRLVGAAMDIDDRKRAEAVLRDQLALKDQLAKVAASAPGVICSFRLRPDGSARMEFSAPAVVDLFGFPQEALARDMASVFRRTPPDDLARVNDAVAESARTLSPWSAEFRYQHPTKGLRWIAGTSIPAREADGSTLWHGYVADVTDRKRAEKALRDANERLREADRRKDEFLAMLSHELRNPLAPIRNSLYMLRHGAGPPADRAMVVIERQVEHLTRLVDDLLDVTRISRGKVQLRRERLELRELVRRVGEDFRSILEERGIAFELALPDERIWADADGTRVAQVVSNLLHNAAKFTRPGDAVRLALERAGDAARLRVRDTGAGIEPAQLEKVFEAFVQADRTLARSEGGLGLGLALVKGLVGLHGGSVSASSAGQGKGTEFTVELPLAADAVEWRPAPAAPRPRGAGRRVLVVDDNRDAADSLGQLALVLGHDVDVAYDGHTALAKLGERPADVVLCDIGLPGIDGYEVARRIRRLSASRVRLVAVSGYAQPEDVARALEAGFDAHLAKPPDPEKLARLIDGA